MIANTNHPFDPRHLSGAMRAEKLIAHPMLVRAASFGAAAGALALSALFLVTMKISWRPDTPITDGFVITAQSIDESAADPPPRPIQTPDRPVEEGFEILPPDESIVSASVQTEPSTSVGYVTPVIAEPHWLETPNARDFERHYPPRALHRGMGGRVVLDCTVGASGRIACDVASETPQGNGFGEAALRIAQSFRMAPQTVDGRPTDGGRVRVPITFRAE
jgi:protein TonB